MRKILIILGHPDKESFSGSVASAYEEGASSAAQVKRINLGDLEFDPVLHRGYKVIQQLEPDLLQAQRDIWWADHLVWVYPNWWSSPPAVMKGFIDRAWHPGFAFKYLSKTDFFPKQLLKGRSAHLIVTLDARPLIDRVLLGRCEINMMKKAVLLLAGIRPVQTTVLGSVKLSSLKQRRKWLEQVKEEARRFAGMPPAGKEITTEKERRAA